MVEHLPQDHEVVGLCPSFPISISLAGPSKRCNTTDFPRNIDSWLCSLGVKQAQTWQKLICRNLFVQEICVEYNIDKSNGEPTDDA